MRKHGHGHHERPDTSLGFEQSDLSFSGIKWGVLGYFIFTFLVGVAAFILILVLGAVGPPKDLGVRRLPPAPNPMLQNNVTARTDIWNLRAREDFLLNNVSWVSQKEGVVRIPINDAINLAASRGPAGLSKLPPGYEAPATNTRAVGETVSAAGVKPANSSAGAELTSTGNGPTGTGASRVTVPEGGKSR